MAGPENPFNPPRSAWPANFPPVALHATEAAVKSFKGYAAAKAGDVAAAMRLVEAMLDIDATDALARAFSGSYPILLPVVAEEQTGANAIPMTLAVAISKRTGWPVDSSIWQANIVARTGQDGYYRLAIQPVFAGAVQRGQGYVMVDDFVGQGATLANLRGFVLANDGRVIGSTALTGKARSAMLALSSQTLTRLRDLHGQDLEPWWREFFGFDCLTESEALYLIERTDAQRIRTEILARIGNFH